MRTTRSKAVYVPKRMIGRIEEAAANAPKTISDIAEDPSDVIDLPVRAVRRASARRRRSKR